VPSPISFHFINDLVRLFDDVTPDKLPSPLNGSNTVVAAVPIENFKHWGLSLHAGISIPQDDGFNPGPNFGLDLEYRFSQFFSLEWLYGLHHFRGETFGPFTFDNTNLHQLSGNVKFYGGNGNSFVRPFVNAGGGAYWFQPGAEVHAGFNVGGGLQFNVKKNIAVEGSYNFHNVVTDGPNFKFSTVQGGVRFRF